MGNRSAIDEFARGQYGVFNTRQIREAGYDRSAVQRRIRSGEWIRLGPSVFCLASSPPKWERQLAAAVLSRRRALVGGTSAAALHGFRGIPREHPTIVVPEGSNARMSFGRVIRTKHFDSIATADVAGFTATSVAETVFALLRDLPERVMSGILEDMLLARKAGIEAFYPILDREVGSPWVAVMEKLVVEHSETAASTDGSYLEARLEKLLRKASLPRWERESPFTIRGRNARVDVFIPDWLLVIEADGRAWHGRQVDMEADRRRDAWLASQGIQVIRLTYSMIAEDPDGCLAMIRSAGAHRSASRGA